MVRDHRTAMCYSLCNAHGIYFERLFRELQLENLISLLDLGSMQSLHTAS